MTTETKIAAAIVGVCAVLGAIAFFGVSPFSARLIQSVGSPVGTTFNTAKIASVNISPANGTATSSSILNTDASARYILTGFTSCTGVGSSNTAYTGVGLAALLMQVATTSSAGANLNTTNLALNLTVSTSSGFSNNASTTVPIGVLAYWPSNVNLTFAFNATNTGACTAGVYYIGS